jgi:hypothetical protein
LREVEAAARAIGLQIQVVNAGTIREINAAFATFARERPDALFIDQSEGPARARSSITRANDRGIRPARVPQPDVLLCRSWQRKAAQRGRLIAP